MARILEALSRMPAPSSSGRLEPTPAAVPAPARAVAAPLESAAPESSVAPAAPVELPFIEVGSGPMTGSSCVLAGSAPEAIRLAPVAAATPSVDGIVLQPIPGSAGGRPLASRLAPELAAFHQPQGETARQYHDLLDAVLKNQEAAPTSGQVLLFSSLGADASSTPVVLNLALTHARQGSAPRGAVVVDAGMGEGSVHRLLGLSPSPGLCEVLTGAVPLHRAVRDSGIPGCQVLSGGAAGKTCLPVKSVLATLAQLRRRFELVLLDAPAWHGQPGLIELAAACDAVYLVAGRKQAAADGLRPLADSLPALGVPLRGCIVTQ